MLIELFTKIWEDTGILMVQAEQEGARVPPLPYGVYKATSPYIKGKGRGNTSYTGDAVSAQEIFTEQPLMTISSNLFAQSGDEAMNLAMRLHEWFLFAGSDYLLDNSIAVRSLGNVENRTTHLVDHYEYKYGFDVQLRTEKTLVKEIDWIEKVQITGGE